eukprot:scaffold308095_cov32-Tisochrysis_lutea.AAC.4
MRLPTNPSTVMANDSVKKAATVNIIANTIHHLTSDMYCDFNSSLWVDMPLIGDLPVCAKVSRCSWVACLAKETDESCANEWRSLPGALVDRLGGVASPTPSSSSSACKSRLSTDSRTTRATCAAFNCAVKLRWEFKVDV